MLINNSIQNTKIDLTTIIIIIGLLSCLVIFFLIKSFANKSRLNKQEKLSINSTLFEIRLPKSTEVDAQSADQIYSTLVSISSTPKNFLKRMFYAPNWVSFEIVALPESIRYYICVPNKIAQLVEKQLHGAYPDAEIKASEEHNIISENSFVEFASLKLDQKQYKPIRTYPNLHIDTQAAITSAMSRLSEGEGIALQVLITPAEKKWRKLGRDFIRSVRESGQESSSSSDGKDKPAPKPKQKDDEGVAETEKKIMKPAFYTDIRIVACSKTKDVAKMHLANVLSSFDQMEMPGSNKFTKVKFKNEESRQEFIQDFIYRNPKKTCVLNTEELATVFHLPNKHIQTPFIRWLFSKRSPAAEEVPSTPPGIYVGKATFRGIEKPVFMTVDDRRRHMYIIGKTGSGKSYQLQSMIIQDIYNGEGVCFIDPHGDSAEWVLRRIPPERADDVIYFNPADLERPLGFNLIEADDEVQQGLVCNAFIGLLYKMFDPNKQGIVGPRLERAVRNAILTAFAVPGSTLIEVAKILYDPMLVKKVFLPHVKDTLVRDYWEKEIAQTREEQKSEVLGYIVSKFDRFITNKTMRNIMGQSKSGFDLNDVMNNRKILIVNLSKGVVGEENAQFLGLLIIPKIVAAAMSRAKIPQDQRKDFYLYVDEFQNFSTEEFTNILSEARKYRLNLIVANQYIAQMNEKVKDAIFGNVGTVMSFKVGVNDAQYLQNEFAPIFSQNDLINLENTIAYIKMLVKGEYPPPFSLATRYDKESKDLTMIHGKNYPASEKFYEMIKELSRYRYGKDTSIIEQEIEQRSKY